MNTSGNYLMSDLKLLYKDLIKNESFQEDRSQYSAVKILDNLQFQISKQNKKRNIFSTIFTILTRNYFQNESFFITGIYLHGGVGTGKSMIMNLFFKCVKIKEKRRVHFHEFMNEFHQETKKIRNLKNKDPIKKICDEISKKIKVLCFDEFQIVDITDAMIVGRLFEELIKKNVIIITTSNFKPFELYKDGLNRKLFLPFIDFIEDKFKILEVDNKIDYRKKKLTIQNRFFLEKKMKDLDRFNTLWENFNGNNSTEFTIIYQSRKFRLEKFVNGVCRISFKELCENPLSTLDYLELCKYVKVLFLENIPHLNNSQNDFARRFINLIDILYEARIKLICFSFVELEKIYKGSKLEKEFMRTISRLNEMISNDWFN